MIVKEEVWEEKTLEDVENLKVELSRRLHLQHNLTQYRVLCSSIAIVFRIPRWIEINLMELESFLLQNHIIEVHIMDHGIKSDKMKDVSGFLLL